MANPATSIKPKPKPKIYATHTQYAVVNASDIPMNQWAIFTNPATSIKLWHREDIAEKDLSNLQRQFQKSDLRFARVVEVTVSWEKSSND